MLIRLHVADTFRDCGFEVIEAADGEEAIKCLQRESIDAVFTDVTLPGQSDGFAVARWTKKNRPGIPVILTSGEVTAAHAETVSKDEPFFGKPCDYMQIAKFIRGLLQECDA